MHDHDRDVRACFVGDSYVAGTGDPAVLGWVGRVAAAAIASGVRLSTYNLGIRGDTASMVADRLAAESRPRLAAAEDPRLVVSFGVNDTVLRDGARRAEPDETLGALRRVHALAGEVPVFLVGPPATSDPDQNRRLAALDAALTTEAAVLGVPVLSVFAATLGSPVWQEQVAADDGYHPRAEGYAVLAEAVAPVLVPWLAAPPSAS